MPSRDDKTKDERKQLNVDFSLPYELLALESALAAYNKELDTEATEIESLAVPCLDRLAARVCSGHSSGNFILCWHGMLYHNSAWQLQQRPR